MTACSCVYDNGRCFPLLRWAVRLGLYKCQQSRKHPQQKLIQDVIDSRRKGGDE